jgi:hypothetical protein
LNFRLETRVNPAGVCIDRQEAAMASRTLMKIGRAGLAGALLWAASAAAVAGPAEAASAAASTASGVATRVGHAVQRGAGKAASAVERGARKTAEAVGRAASATGRAVERTAQKVALPASAASAP